MSTDTVLGIVLGGGLALCCAVLYCRRRRRGFLSFSSLTSVDEEDVRFQRRLEAATAGAFEGGGDDAELELTAKEIQAIQSLELELREMRTRRAGAVAASASAAAVMAPLPPQAAAAARPSKPTAARAGSAAAAQAVEGGGKMAVAVAAEQSGTETTQLKK
jgi:hypothetical protein